MTVRTVDTWLGDGAVLATLHLPETASEVGVVIVPPFGYEYAVAYRTLRHVADRIALGGMAAIRYDHPGFGDSTVPLATDSLATGVGLAADALHRAGVERIVYLGLGSGALVASEAASADPAAAGVVLWDPAASGRQWLRRQKSLYTIEMGDEAEETPEGVVEIAGAEFPEWFAARLQSLEYSPESARRIPTLLALRSGPTGTVPKSLRDVADLLQVVEVPGHEDSLDLSSILATIPATSVRLVTEWLVENFAGARQVALRVPDAVVDADLTEGGHPIVESIVRIGPHELFAIETTPLGADAETPAVVLHNGSAEHRIGATRHQVTMARKLAARGMRVVRVDRRGTGESGPVVADEPSMLFTQEWIEDGEQTVTHLDLPREKVGVVGMCVGGWLGLVAAPEKTKFVATVAMNNYRSIPRAPLAALDGVEQGTEPSGPRFIDRVAVFAKENLPYRALVGLAARGHLEFAEPNLRRAIQGGTDVLLIMGPKDTGVFNAHGGDRAVPRMDRLSARLGDAGGKLWVVERPTGDHALYSPGIRNDAIEMSVEFAAKSFQLPPVAVPRPAGAGSGERASAGPAVSAGQPVSAGSARVSA